MNTIFVLVGASGSGKTTVADALEMKYGLKNIQSYTTRPKRDSNEYGHIFVDDKEFDALKDLVGYTEYHNYRYCATSEQVDNNDIYVLNPDGIKYLKENYRGTKDIKVIYIKVDFITRLIRVIKRKDGIIKTISRFIFDIREFKGTHTIADYTVVNKGSIDAFVDTLYNTVINKI